MVAAATGLALTALDRLATPETCARANTSREEGRRFMRLTTAHLVLPILFAGCAGFAQPTTDNTATADVRDARGQSVGTATLTQLGNSVRVVLNMRGMPPGAKGVHIHEVGKCEAPPFTTAGGHFNPHGKQHGALNPQGPHAGDLPNITIGSDGSGRLESTTELVTLTPGPASLFDADGSALVVHAGPDDFKTDPTGNSGGRIACGVIVKSAGGSGGR
jgi:Cu-Zn family superoxide dismutase